MFFFLLPFSIFNLQETTIYTGECVWLVKSDHCFAYVLLVRLASMLGWGMGNIKAPGYLIITRKMSFLPATCNIIVSIDSKSCFLNSPWFCFVNHFQGRTHLCVQENDFRFSFGGYLAISCVDKRPRPPEFV